MILGQTSLLLDTGKSQSCEIKSNAIAFYLHKRVEIILYTGVFDRFPELKIALGHMGEGPSWILPRTDSTFRLYNAG